MGKYRKYLECGESAVGKSKERLDPSLWLSSHCQPNKLLQRQEDKLWPEKLWEERGRTPETPEYKLEVCKMDTACRWRQKTVQHAVWHGEKEAKMTGHVYEVEPMTSAAGQTSLERKGKWE